LALISENTPLNSFLFLHGTDSENDLIKLFKKRINLLNNTSLDENEYNQTYFKHSGLTNVEIRSYQLHGIRRLIERYEVGHGASQRIFRQLHFYCMCTK
jgi:hypothetical protein